MIADEESARRFVAARCDPSSLTRLDFFDAALRSENQRQNLVSRGTLNSLWQRHFADSAQLVDYLSPDGRSWLDLGTGAGFPGLVIAVMCPGIAVTLVESRRMRVEWLERMREQLGLTNCRVEGRRVETIEAFPAQVISARAFAPLPKLIQLARRFSTSDTLWLLPKGRSAEQELAELSGEVRKMFHVEQSHTDPEAKILVGKEAKQA